MELKVFWTSFAKTELKNIYDYHKKVASIQVAQKIVKSIALETKYLTKLPEIGQIEACLKNREQNFRYIIYSNYKIIYWINTKEFQIEIVDVFDCRQNQIKISRNK